MKYRKQTVYGSHYSVPPNIVRVEFGWQLRFGKWKLFTDYSRDGSGAESALKDAIKELIKRIKTSQVPSGLNRKIHISKKNKLPSGISGPRKYLRKGRLFLEYCFQVTVPIFGKKPATRSVYIGTENTITNERVEAALVKAKNIRQKAEEAYQTAITNARRLDVQSN